MPLRNELRKETHAPRMPSDTSSAMEAGLRILARMIVEQWLREKYAECSANGQETESNDRNQGGDLSCPRRSDGFDARQPKTR